MLLLFVVVRPSYSKMTMTLGSFLSLFVCLEVADKAKGREIRIITSMYAQVNSAFRAF